MVNTGSQICGVWSGNSVLVIVEEHPNAYVLLIILGIFFVLISLILFWNRIYYSIRFPIKGTKRIRLSVKKISNGSRSGKNKALYIIIENTGRIQIEITAPVLELLKDRNIKKFQPKTGGSAEFPLLLLPGTSHEFKIDIGKIKDANAELRAYKNARIIISDTSHSFIKRKLLNI
ncbi:MAG: hypothetical protein JXJ22_12725 [Bacteroidales bacterium]|nr:hypothetical protein [Bacteroidales bacterium]